jgi:hypothetical protein
MNLRSLMICAAAALPAAAFAAPPASAPLSRPAASATATVAETFHRVELKAAQSIGKPLPYTVEVPRGWEVRQVDGYPGLWIGPADAKPPEDPRLLWVRGSRVSMEKPDEIVANIRANDASKPEWSAPRVEVQEVGGVRGVLVQMDTGEGDKARSSLTLKLPLANLGVDFVASAPRAEFPKREPLFERILLSVRPVVDTAAKK